MEEITNTKDNVSTLKYHDHDLCYKPGLQLQQ